MKRLSILGSTGSIGTSTMQLLESVPGRFEVVALAAGRNLDLLEKQVRRFNPRMVVVADRDRAGELKGRIGSGFELLHGVEGLERAARHPAADMVVCGLVGALGLRPAYAAADAGIDLALANKEALVVGGRFVTERAAASGAAILPVDSEHNALHQCLRGEKPDEVRNLWLTASGGPFRKTPAERLATVTAEDALRHPTWNMGRKITIDSATLMNKGLEIIEARWLFGFPSEMIKVVVHPQSVVHSMVEFVDGSFKAQLGITDMRHPIEYSLTWPERTETALPPFNPVDAARLEFHEPDVDRFPCLQLARDALRAGGAAPAVLNAANEVAVQAFLDGTIGFTDIPVVISRVLEKHSGHPCDTMAEILEADAVSRKSAGAGLLRGVRR